MVNTRTWYSPAQGETTPLIVLDIRGWTTYEVGHHIHHIDDSNVDVSGGEEDWTAYDANAFRLVFSEAIGGAEIAGATLSGSEIAINGAATAGDLRIVAPASKTGALQTYLEGKGIARRGVLYANLYGVESGETRSVWWAKVHVQFTAKASA